MNCEGAKTEANGSDAGMRLFTIVAVAGSSAFHHANPFTGSYAEKYSASLSA